MNAVSSKTFKSGNSVAVRLPKEIAFAPGLEVVIERKGDTLTIRPAVDPAEEKRKLLEMIEALKAIGPPGQIEKREPIYFPRRRGL
jgi:antitoxin VapB